MFFGCVIVSHESLNVHFFSRARSSHKDGQEGSKVQCRKDFEEADEHGEFARRQLLTEFGIDSTALLNKDRTVTMALGSELQQQGSAGRRFCFRDQSFANERLNGAMNDGAVQCEQGGNLILVQGGAAAQGGQYKAARLRALRFLLHAPGDVEVGGREVYENGVLENFFGDESIVREDHRMVTVDSRGRRHWG